MGRQRCSALEENHNLAIHSHNQSNSTLLSLTLKPLQASLLQHCWSNTNNDRRGEWRRQNRNGRWRNFHPNSPGSPIKIERTSFWQWRSIQTKRVSTLGKISLLRNPWKWRSTMSTEWSTWAVLLLIIYDDSAKTWAWHTLVLLASLRSENPSQLTSKAWRTWNKVGSHQLLSHQEGPVQSFAL